MGLKLEQIIFGGNAGRGSVPKDWKLIGFYDSPETNTNLTLASIGMGLNKSKFLRKVVEEWLKDHDVLSIAIWKIKTLKVSEIEKGVDVKEFDSKIKTFLEEKKLPGELVKKILSSI